MSTNPVDGQLIPLNEAAATMPTYKVTATHRGDTVEFTAEAPSSPKAVAQAREMATAQGMGRIMVSAVCPEPVFASEEDTERLDVSHGPPLSLDEVNAEIARMLGDVSLKAYADSGHICLSDGINNPADLEDRSLIGITELIYEWAVYVGETSESFEDFLEMA